MTACSVVTRGPSPPAPAAPLAADSPELPWPPSGGRPRGLWAASSAQALLGVLRKFSLYQEGKRSALNGPLCSSLIRNLLAFSAGNCTQAQK